MPEFARPQHAPTPGFMLTFASVDLQMDPQICRVVHYGIQRGMGMTGVTLAALLTSGMRIFFRKTAPGTQPQDLIDRKKAEQMDAEVTLNQ